MPARGPKHIDGNAESTVGRGAALVTELLGSRRTEVTRSVYDALAAEISELRDDQQTLDLLYSSVESNVETIFDSLEHDIALEHIQPPTAALEYARRLAQRGVPVPALIRAYRLGQQALLQLVLDEIRRSGFDPEVNLEIFGQTTTIVSSYIDWISQQVLATYEAERERWVENRSHLRGERVRDVLAGTEIDVDAAGVALGYPLRVTHLALVLWFDEHSGSATRFADLEQIVADVAESLAIRMNPLFVAVDRISGWAWIPFTGPVPDRASLAMRIERALASRSGGLRLAVGNALPGLDGFRRSHRQALRARGVAVTAGASAQQVTVAGTPGLSAAALLGADLDHARGWVLDVLGPLATDTDTDARLRDTLRIFLRHGSYKAAAEELNLHFNSIKYRVRRASERRGVPIGEDRLDVELALLACQWLGTAVLIPPDKPPR